MVPHCEVRVTGTDLLLLTMFVSCKDVCISCIGWKRDLAPDLAGDYAPFALAPPPMCPESTYVATRTTTHCTKDNSKRNELTVSCSDFPVDYLIHINSLRYQARHIASSSAHRNSAYHDTLATALSSDLLQACRVSKAKLPKHARHFKK